MKLHHKTHLRRLDDPTKPVCGQKRKGFNSPELILVDEFFDMTCRQCQNTINAQWRNKNTNQVIEKLVFPVATLSNAGGVDLFPFAGEITIEPVPMVKISNDLIYMAGPEIKVLTAEEMKKNYG